MIAPVFALLSAGSTSAYVGTRIYRHGYAPQGVAKPYITWSTVGGHVESYIADAPGIDQARTQIDIWSADMKQCGDIAAAVVADLEGDGYQDGLPFDTFDEVTQLYRITLSFYFWTSR